MHMHMGTCIWACAEVQMIMTGAFFAKFFIDDRSRPAPFRFKFKFYATGLNFKILKFYNLTAVPAET